MDADALATFLAVRQSGSFSDAASRLRRSQPAISRRIALLEDEIGARLFERASGGVVLSQAGHLLLPHAQRVLAAIEDCRSALAALGRGEAGRISIAAVGTLAGANLTPLLKRFSLRHRGVELRLRTASSAEVSEMVRRGEASLGLRYHRDNAPDLECRVIGQEVQRIVCAPEHPLAGRTMRSLRDLAAERWLVFPNFDKLQEPAASNLFAQALLQGLGDLQWQPVDSLTAQKRLAEAGFGLAVLPESAIGDELAAGSLAVIAVRGLRLANPVSLVTRANGYFSPAALALIDMLAHGAIARSQRAKGALARRARGRKRAP